MRHAANMPSRMQTAAIHAIMRRNVRAGACTIAAGTSNVNAHGVPSIGPDTDSTRPRPSRSYSVTRPKTGRCDGLATGCPDWLQSVPSALIMYVAASLPRTVATCSDACQDVAIRRQTTRNPDEGSPTRATMGKRTALPSRWSLP